MNTYIYFRERGNTSLEQEPTTKDVGMFRQRKTVDDLLATGTAFSYDGETVSYTVEFRGKPTTMRIGVRKA